MKAVNFFTVKLGKNKETNKKWYWQKKRKQGVLKKQKKNGGQQKIETKEQVWKTHFSNVVHGF